MGVIVISGCVDLQAQPSTSNAPGALYDSLFDPFGLPGHKIPNMYIGPQVPPPESLSLQNATLLLDDNIKKAEAISAKLDPGVQYLREQGKDVSRLESLLEEYKSLLEEAKNYRALAASSSGEEYSTGMNENSENGPSAESSVKEYLIQSQKSMIRANMVLKDIFDEFKRLMPGSIELKKLDRLNATGDGRVTLTGSFDLNLHLQEGEMVVMDFSPDSAINIEGNYTLEIKDRRQLNMRIYHIQSADVEFSGSRKMLLLSGENITVEADGEGYAVFFGNGTYSIEDADGIMKEEQWAVNSFFEEQMGPERPGRTENKIATVYT